MDIGEIIIIDIGIIIFVLILLPGVFKRPNKYEI